MYLGLVSLPKVSLTLGFAISDRGYNFKSCKQYLKKAILILIEFPFTAYNGMASNNEDIL